MSNTDTQTESTPQAAPKWEGAPMKEISIYENSFSVPQPYKEGHTCSAVEAKVLNQTFAENIANNQRANIKKALEGGEGAPSMDEALSQFNTYAMSYEFSEGGVGGGSTLTPVEREARSIARAHINSQLKAQGRKRKEIDEEKFEAEVERIASLEAIVNLAKENVAKKQDEADKVAQLLAAAA
jgi:hypothetical protein